MSKKNFFVPYYGNKYQETANTIEKGLSGIDWSTIDYIVEPFCGSAGFSRYIYYNVPAYKGKFIWCDVDEGLVRFMDLVKNKKFPELFEKIKNEATKITTKEEFKAYRAELDPSKGEDWYALKRVRGSQREELFNAESIKRLFGSKMERLQPLITFLESGRVEIVCRSSAETKVEVEKLSASHSVLVYCDPPYFQSCNSYYVSCSKVESVQAEQGNHRYTDPDSSGMFVDILSMMKNPTVICVCVLNKSFLMEQFYNGFVVCEYDKTYSQPHKNKKTGESYLKQSKHMVISNFKK